MPSAGSTLTSAPLLPASILHLPMTTTESTTSARTIRSKSLSRLVSSSILPSFTLTGSDLSAGIIVSATFSFPMGIFSGSSSASGSIVDPSAFSRQESEPLCSSGRLPASDWPDYQPKAIPVFDYESYFWLIWSESITPHTTLYQPRTTQNATAAVDTDCACSKTTAAISVLYTPISDAIDHSSAVVGFCVLCHVLPRFTAARAISLRSRTTLVWIMLASLLPFSGSAVDFWDKQSASELSSFCI